MDPTQLGIFANTFSRPSLAGVLDDHDPAQRETALSCSLDFVRMCAEVFDSVAFVLRGRVTEGMALDMDTWWLVSGTRAQAIGPGDSDRGRAPS